ncbi:MAG: thioredoxin family protein [Symploca sp. SIO2C1]|nr:thioredoxin family protein [Symploca sp. SIO2C1]
MLGYFRRSALVSRCCLSLVAIVSCLLLLGTPSALAGLNDDNYDGNIFAIYAGNGSLVPPRVSLKEALKRQRPALLVFYLDDSSDCKGYSIVVSRLQGPYGRVAAFIPINTDTLSPRTTYTSKEPGYYYEGLVPQTVLIDQQGKVVFNETGELTYEQVDDVFREVFDLLPRTESVELKRRVINEINTQLSEN